MHVCIPWGVPSHGQEMNVLFRTFSNANDSHLERGGGGKFLGAMEGVIKHATIFIFFKNTTIDLKAFKAPERGKGLHGYTFMSLESL